MKKIRETLSAGPPHPEHVDGPAPAPIDPASGQHEDHWVLPEADRNRLRVRPVRSSYKHVGLKTPGVLRDLTPDEVERHLPSVYAKYEAYPESEHPCTGKFWTQAELDSLGGCGQVTTMPQAIAETISADPTYYGQTFCCGCKKYLPVAEFVWKGTSDRVGS
jgi:hypothetical protein